MYQISAARALKFVTPSYIPTQRVRKANLAIANTTDSSFQYAVEIAANTSGNGAIEVVHVTGGGTNYRFETGALQTFTETTTTAKIVGTGLGDDDVIGSDIYFTSGDQSGTGGTITDYVASTDVVTWAPATAAAPATGDSYSIGPKVTITGDGHGGNGRATNTASGVLGDIVVVAGGNNYGNAVATVTTTGGANTFLGYNTDADAAGDSGHTRIGYKGAIKYITNRVTCTAAHTGVNSVIVEVCKIPALSIITSISAVVITNSGNLGTYSLNLSLSTTTGSSADAALANSGTSITVPELLGAGAANTYQKSSAIAMAGTAIDIIAGSGATEKIVHYNEPTTTIVGTNDTYIYVCNAVDNGTADSDEPAVLEVVVGYIGID